MPRLNGMGPQGLGPLTGQGMGQCVNGERMNCCRRRPLGQKNFRFRMPLENQLEVLDEEEKALLADLEAIKAKKESLKNQQ